MSSSWSIIVLLLIVLGAITGRNQLLLIGVMLGLIHLVSILWKRYSLTGVTYERRFENDRLFLGEETTMSVRFSNAKPLPLPWLITVDEIPAQIELLSGEALRTPDPKRRLFVNSLSLRWYERVTRSYRIKGLQRGVWGFGPLQLSAGGIFGFSVNRISLPAISTLLVYPKMVPLASLGLSDWHPFGDFRTPRRALSDPMRLMGAREYTSGDNYRHIHWKATAHRRSLQTKVFEPSASRQLALFLNVRTSPFVNEGIDRDVLELGIITVASIARWCWEMGYPVGLFANTLMLGNRQRVNIRPARRPEQLMIILEALARLEDVSHWTMATLLNVETAKLSYGASIIVVSPLLNKRLRSTLISLRRREFSVILITLGDLPDEEEIPGVKRHHLGRETIWHELETLALAE